MTPASNKRERRHYDKDQAPDNRSEFQRDRDRVLYSAAWRRLGHVTQVVSPTEGIVFHDRLTHTLEVAQIGRRIAERLTNDREGKQKASRLGGVHPDVVETAALVHDLGHPPYGHAVEVELNRLVSKYSHDGYEGNAQSFRIVTKLAKRKLTFGGLDLTYASLNAALKYPWKRASEDYSEQHTDDGVDRHKKWGVYDTEIEEYGAARSILPHDEDKKCIEAEIMDWADDVAYAVHDVEDFYRAGLIPLERFVEDEPEVSRFAEYAEKNLPDDLKLNQDDIKSTLLLVTEENPMERPYVGSPTQRAGLKASSSSMIADCVKEVSLAEDIHDGALLNVPTWLKQRVEVLKQLTWFYVIDNRAIKVQQQGQRRVVRDLFKSYFLATKASDSDLRGILPESYADLLDDEPDKAKRARIVADLISSMTERQLLMIHKRLTGIELGSITDLM